jgi:hypothetical protein
LAGKEVKIYIIAFSNMHDAFGKTLAQEPRLYILHSSSSSSNSSIERSVSGYDDRISHNPHINRKASGHTLGSTTVNVHRPTFILPKCFNRRSFFESG